MRWSGRRAVRRLQFPGGEPLGRPRLCEPRSPHPAGRPLMRIFRAISPIRAAAFGALIVLLYLLLALLGAAGLTPHNALKQFPLDRLKPPNAVYWLGTDLLGRDTFSRLMLGHRPELCRRLRLGRRGYPGRHADRPARRLVGRPVGQRPDAPHGCAAGLPRDPARPDDHRHRRPGHLHQRRRHRHRLHPDLRPRCPRPGPVAEAARFRRRCPYFWQLAALHPDPPPAAQSRRPADRAGYPRLAWALLTEAGLSFLGLGTQPPAPLARADARRQQEFDAARPLADAVSGAHRDARHPRLQLTGDALRDILDPRTQGRTA